MLKSFTLKNFKSFKEATLQLSPTVTFLIGANASGKTNALEALRFLSWLGQGNRLEEIETKINGGNQFVRGTVSDIFRFGSNSIGFNVCLDDNQVPLEWTAEYADRANGGEEVPALSYAKHFFTNKESLIDHSTHAAIYEFPAKNGSGKTTLMGALQQGEANGKAFFCVLESLSLLLAGAGLPGPDSKRAAMIYQASKACTTHFSAMQFYDFEPSAMRSYVSQNGNLKLAEDGRNVSEVLENLCRDDKQKEGILKVVGDLPEHSYTDIHFMGTEAQEVMAVLTEKTVTELHHTSAKLLSDGTLRALAIAAALYAAPEGSLIVIEEVDNGIHPSRIKALVDKMYEIATERHIQILVTTHDPAMMDAIPPQEKGNILCCYRSKEDGTSRILRFADSPHCDFIVNSHQLGEFVKTALFETTINDTRSVAEVHQKQSDWLNNFVASIENIRAKEVQHE